MVREISNNDDVIDSRDVIARIAELEGELADAEEVPEAFSAEDLDDIRYELDALRALAEEGEGSPDWPYGETLIRDTYFVEYAQQLAEDIGAIDSDAGWPARCIDWDRAADELRMDYLSVEFDGVTYWIRA